MWLYQGDRYQREPQSLDQELEGSTHKGRCSLHYSATLLMFEYEIGGESLVHEAEENNFCGEELISLGKNDWCCNEVPWPV